MRTVEHPLPVCTYCGETIPEDVLAGRHHSPANSPKRQFCNQEHVRLWRKENGIFAQMSKKGNAVMKERGTYRDVHRIAGIATSNRSKPRRRKKTSD